MPPLSSRNNPDSDDCYLDLLVKKKLLSQDRPSPDRPSTFYINYEEQVKKELSHQFKSITIDEASIEEQEEEVSMTNHNEQEIQQEEGEINAESIADERLGKERKPSAGMMTFYQAGQTVVVPEKSMRIRDKATLPPFSFTNYKWRSKSELETVDKWKQKYGKPQNHSSLKQLKDPYRGTQKFPTQNDIKRII